jgi:hypothetical protein
VFRTIFETKRSTLGVIVEPTAFGTDPELKRTRPQVNSDAKLAMSAR